MWEIGNFLSADAWLLCGKSTLPASMGSLDTLHVAAGHAHERAITLSVGEIDRPVAFSIPLGSSDIEAQLTFDVRSTPGLRAVLDAFEVWLRPLRARFMLGAQLMARESQLQRVVYHVSCNGQLLAVLDFVGWKIGLLPEATPEQLVGAIWEKRPAQAHAIPPTFTLSSVEQLRWIYGLHTTRTVLPNRYRRQLIYFAKTPAVPQTWLETSHLLLLRELSGRPASLRELVDRTGLSTEQATRDLACLYFSGSLTTTPQKAATRAFERVDFPLSQAARVPRAETTIFNSTLPQEANLLLDPDHTAAAGLQRE